MDLTERHQDKKHHKPNTVVVNFGSSYYPHIVILSLFIVLAIFFIFTGYSPTQDAISWQGVFHSFYNSVENGVMPYWNPYSQMGTPFYVYYQPFGLLEPSNFVFILFQKITGCTTFTTYILHYLFYYFVFILGAYYLLREITKNNKVSFIFAVILFLGCFPMFMTQNGALNSFVLVPFIFYFILVFLNEQIYKKKCLFAITSVYLSAISLNIYIPTGLMFAVLLFLFLSFLVKFSRFKQTVEFFKTKQGILTFSLSIVIIILIACPVLALYHDFHDDNEMFPTARVLQKNRNTLVKLYATDIKDDLFSEKFTDNTKVSDNMENLFGLVSEPGNHWLKPAAGENFMYVSILPLLCCVVAFRNRRYNYQVYVFSGLALLTLLLMENFSVDIVTKPGILQTIIITVLPFLKSMEVLENFAPFFLLCIVILGALGFENIHKNNKNKVIWRVSIVAIALKLLILMILIIVMKHVVHKDLFYPVAFLVLLIIIFTRKLFDRVSEDKIQAMAMILLFLDLIVFASFHATHFGLHKPYFYYEKDLYKTYFNILKDNEILSTKQEKDFTNYRVPFSYSPRFSQDSKSLLTFWGYEVYSAKKTAFANVYGVHLFQDIAPLWDHFYMTKYYYDHLVNITPGRQLVTANIITPILNYYPNKNVKLLENKYDVVDSINRTKIEELGKYIFIEKNQDAHLTSPNVASFFDLDNRLQFNKDEVNDFSVNQNKKYQDNKGLVYNVTSYDINNLSLDIKTPKDGYFYFGDGYSKYWNADVDGMKTEIYKTNINAKSVYVAAGAHHVSFHYDPFYFRYALYAYLTGNILAICLIVALYFRSKLVEGI